MDGRIFFKKCSFIDCHVLPPHIWWFGVRFMKHESDVLDAILKIM
jgi:hypothetical protein